jgi:hypothetical protein
MTAATTTCASAQQQDKQARRLESVTWHPVDHKLTWTVSKGVLNKSGKFEESEKSNYEIDMDAATMAFEGKERRFSKAEAVSVHQLMDMVAKYAAESTVWWIAGKGEPVDEDGKQKLKQRDHEEPSYRPERPRKSDPSDTKVIRIRLAQADSSEELKNLTQLFAVSPEPVLESELIHQ